MPQVIYHFAQLKRLLNQINIDIELALLDEEIKDEYYSMDFLRHTDPIYVPDEEGILMAIDHLSSEKIWRVSFNGLFYNSFFEKYASLEKAMIDELKKNKEIAEIGVISDFSSNEYFSFFGDRNNCIKYDQEKNCFQCSFVEYGEHIKKHQTPGIFESEIQCFLRELSEKLSDTYLLLKEAFNQNFPNIDLNWEKTDTDLIELITALLETKSISNSKGFPTRKDAIDLFTRVFNHPIKDAESKLSHATNKSSYASPYLTALKEAVINYVKMKEERRDV